MYARLPSLDTTPRELRAVQQGVGGRERSTAAPSAHANWKALTALGKYDVARTLPSAWRTTDSTSDLAQGAARGACREAYGEKHAPCAYRPSDSRG